MAEQVTTLHGSLLVNISVGGICSMAVLKLKPFCSLICFIGNSDVVTAVSHLEDVTVRLTLSFSSHCVKVGDKIIFFGL